MKKHAIVAFILFILTLFMWMSSQFWGFSREEYLSQKVLELSTPINVKIDLQLLEKLSPAYE
jgi:hypothetical protein